MKKILFTLWLLIANACISTQPVLRLIDQQEHYLWYGEHQDTTFILSIIGQDRNSAR